MKLKKEFKKDAKLILVVVVLLALLTLNLSYSLIFSVKSVSTIQEISAGTLSVVIDNTSTPIYDDLLPTANSLLPSSSNSEINSKYSTITFTNNGTLKTDVALTISKDYDNMPSLSKDEDMLPLNYLNVGLYNGSEWVNFGTDESPQYYVSLSSLQLVSGTTDTYTLVTDTLNVGESKDYRVYVWLSESTPADKIGMLVSLKLNVDYVTSKAETMTQEEIALLNE